MTITISYRRPKYTHVVKGNKHVGKSTDGDYCCEAHYAGHVGYGVGATPEESAKNAAARLYRELGDPEAR